MAIPYTNHADAITQIDSTIRNETISDSVSTDDVSDACVKTNAMLDAIVRTQANGAISYHAPDVREADGAWYTILQSLLSTTATDGDTFTLPAILIQPAAADNSKIEITAPNVTLRGSGCTIKRGAATPVGSGVGMIEVEQTAGGFRCLDVTFDGDGIAIGGSATGYEVYTRAAASFTNCHWVDPVIGYGASLQHNPHQDTDDLLRLMNCTFTHSSYSTFVVTHGRFIMIGGEINIPFDRKTTANETDVPWQRLFMLSSGTGKRISSSLISGVKMYVAKIADNSLPPYTNMGYWNHAGEETPDDIAGVHAAIQDNGAQQIITAGIINPSDRVGGPDACPCQVSLTTGGIVDDILSTRTKITGTLGDGSTVSEFMTATLSKKAVTILSQYYYKTIDEIVIEPQSGTGATTSIGYVVPWLDSAVMRDCEIVYEHNEIQQYTKFEKTREALMDGCKIVNLSKKPDHICPVNTNLECYRLTLNNCIIPQPVGCIGARLRHLVISNSFIGDFDVSNYVQLINNSRFILHIDIRDSTLIGMSGYIFNNGGTNYWDQYDEEATIRMVNINYRYNDLADADYILAYVPRVGFFQAEGLHQDPKYTAADSPEFDEWSNASLTSVNTSRLMATCHPGDTRRAYLGRRLDVPGAMTTLRTGSSNTGHPLPITDGGDAFPGVNGVQGDRIENDYYLSGSYPTITAIPRWIHDGSIWVAEA